MEIPQQLLNSTGICALCFNNGRNRCGQCRSAYYCSRQHQIEHWPTHKRECRKQVPLQAPAYSLPPQPQVQTLSTYDKNPWCGNEQPNDVINMLNEGACGIAPEKPIDFNLTSEDEIFSTLSSELLSSDNNFWELINSCAAQNFFNDGTFLQKDDQPPIPEIPKASSAQKGMSMNILNEKSLNLMQGASLHDICTNVVHDLNMYGICVLDKFIGDTLGTLVLNEVHSLYRKGIFKKGELVTVNPFSTMESVRCDVTTWVNGTEAECVYIGSLMEKLDIVLTTCNKFLNNGLLSKYKLHRRTKAMIACYPGDGTYYKKHIDNPHRDGRCITCIYYLNQNWNVKQHGGLLRMFPSALDSQVAQIEPIFDRMLFFWSDKRNPHEVLPSYATRFAITVWYFDADERDQALLYSRDRTTQAKQ